MEANDPRKLIQNLLKDNTIINSNMVSGVGQNMCKNYLICEREYLNIPKIQGELEAIIWLYIYQMIVKITPKDIRKEREKYNNFPRGDLREHCANLSDKDIEFMILTKKENKYLKKIIDILCPIKSKYLLGEYKHLMERNEAEIFDKISNILEIINIETPDILSEKNELAR